MFNFKFVFVVILIQLTFNQVEAQPQFSWAKSFGSNQNEESTSIAVDLSGNVYTTGFFTFTVDFDPGPSIFNLTAAGNNDIYILKLDALGNFVWAINIGGSGNDKGISIAVDNSGNVFTTGFFTGTADFDPGPGIFNLTSVANTPDIFVLKIDAGGNLVWVNQLGGGGSSQQGNDIAIDASGNVYTTGFFSFTTDFDPGVSNYILSSFGGTDGFISKLDATGTFVWAVQIGGSASPDECTALAIDASGNLLITGSFKGTVDFDPGVGIVNLLSLGNDDVFVLKLNSSGIYLWAKQMGDIGPDSGNGIAVDGLQNIYVTGSFYFCPNDFDPGPGIFNLCSEGSSDIFISKLDASGNFVWAKSMGGPGADVGKSIAIDAAGNVYSIGVFATPSATFANFDPGPGIFNLASVALTSDIYISELDIYGSFVFAGKIGGAAFDNGVAITSDVSGNVFATGIFIGNLDFDPFAGVYNLSSVGNFDPFILKLNNDLIPLPIQLLDFKAKCGNNSVNIEWETASEINNSFFSMERSYDAKTWDLIATIPGAGNSNMNHYYSFSDTCNFQKSKKYYRLKQTDYDGKYQYSNTIALQCAIEISEEINIYPNPTKEKFHLEVNSASGQFIDLQIFDIQGKEIIRLDNFNTNQNVVISNLISGIYLVMIKSPNYHQVIKLIKE